MTDQAAPSVTITPGVGGGTGGASSIVAEVEAKAAGWWATIWAAIKPSMAQAIAGLVLAMLGLGAGMGVQTFRQAAAPPPKPQFVIVGSMEDVKPPLMRIEGKLNQIIEKDPPPAPQAAPPAAKPRPRAAKSTSWF